MKIFYGAAIQGGKDRKARASVHSFFIEAIRAKGFHVWTEHTSGRTYAEAIQMLEKAIGPLPKGDIERRRYVRNKMIEAIEGDIAAAVFEVSTPSLGTGIELAHAYLRPRMGLPVVPVLALYEKEYWPNKLSTMIQGIPPEKVPHFVLREYDNLEEAAVILDDFLHSLDK